MSKNKGKNKSRPKSAAFALAITPAAGIAAVPKSANFLPKSDLKQVNDSLLRTTSSILSKNSVDNDKNHSDDTDNSLPDYVHARGTQSFSGLDTGSRNNTLEHPPPPQGFEDVYDEELDNVTPRNASPFQTSNTGSLKHSSEVKLRMDQLGAGDGIVADERQIFDAGSSRRSEKEANFRKARTEILSARTRTQQSQQHLRQDRERPNSLDRKYYSSDKMQKQDWKEEKATLCDEIRRLNSELGKYLIGKEPAGKLSNDLPGLPLRGPRPDWLTSTKQLAPLFAAYDEQLELKDSLYKKCQSELILLKEQMEKIIVENVRLRMRLEQVSLSGSTNTSEWGRIQEHCKLVLEENCLLMDQLKLQQKKNFAQQNSYVQQIAKCQGELTKERAEKQQLEDEMEKLRKKFTLLNNDDNTLLSKPKTDNTDGNVVKNNKSVQSETSNDIPLLKQLEQLNHSKEEIMLQLKNMQKEKKSMQITMQSAIKALKRSQMKITLLNRVVKEAESKKTDAEVYLKNLLNVIKQFENERDILIFEANKGKFADKSDTSGGTHEKKEVKFAENTLSHTNENLKIDLELLKQKEDFEHELWHLRSLIRTQCEELNSALRDKKQLQDDLEMTWQAVQRNNLNSTE